MLRQLRDRDVLLRLGICLVAVIAVWGSTTAWQPPFPYREGFTPTRDIVARAAFREPDTRATDAARQQARMTVRYVYVQDPEPLVQLRAALARTVTELMAIPSLDHDKERLWSQFYPARSDATTPTPEEQEARFKKFREALSSLEGNAGLTRFEAALSAALAKFERRGLLEKLPQEHNEGDQRQIVVHPRGQPQLTDVVDIPDVIIGDGKAVREALAAQLPDDLAGPAFDWLRPRLPSTLTLNPAETEQAREAAAAAVPEQQIPYEAGQSLIKAGNPLGPRELDLLRQEHRALWLSMSRKDVAIRSLAVLATLISLAALAAYYLAYHQPRLAQSLPGMAALLALVVAAIIGARWAAPDPWGAELIPILLFAMIVAIAYGPEVGVVLTSGISLALVILLGYGPGQIVVLAGTSLVAIMLVGHIRSRVKLTKVGLLAALTAAALTLAVGLVDRQPLNLPLGASAGRAALWALVAGLLMTALLPPLERLFGVVTEISLLELGDIAHPLLQELVRRAPGTYNHSINVASIAEAAAEAIGANGLLVRVGAYFHDIGKMLKPAYFVENQGDSVNRHESLVPAMSTLIIIAHIKDGADLARQHHLPQPIVDFIEQHHGTTLVEYFYRRASERHVADPDAGEVEENAFRYPGPKPQTKEAGVLMLADAVESASRALVEPTPSRIESLVEELALKRLLDGQFDECGLSLRELRTIEDSLIKSLTAVYHGRVKYPSQRTAS